MKNKLTKFTSIGLSSLFTLGSPMSYAAGAKKPVAQSNSTKKILKYAAITVGAPSVALLGIGVPVFAIWKYKSKKSNIPPSGSPTDRHEEIEPPVENHGSTDILGGSSHPSPVVEKDIIKDLQTSQVVSTAASQQEQNPQTVENKENQENTQGINEQLIRQVLGECMVEPFKQASLEAQQQVIELVRKIQEILREDANTLKEFVSDDMKGRIATSHTFKLNALAWIQCICNALDGYIHGEKSQRKYSDVVLDSTYRVCYELNHLILSCALFNAKTHNEHSLKIEKVKACLECLSKYTREVKSCNSHILPVKVIDELCELNGDFSGLPSEINDSKCSRSGFFIHLLHYANKQVNGSVLGATEFKCKGRRLSFIKAISDNNIIWDGKEFEIPKDTLASNGRLYGKFKYTFGIETATLEKIGAEKYICNLESGEITVQ